MVDIQCEFIPPPEAPVFEPTPEEFADPLAYVAKIKPIAEKTGICKIKPPPSWQPPFAVNVDTFKFTPRKQRLNELEAGTRIKLNFLDRLARFWELQGNSLRIPNVERKVLDLFTLQKIVTEEGGFENVTKERRWSKIGSRLGYPSSKGVGSTLRSHYERVLYPFDLFNAGVTIPEPLKEESLKVKEETAPKKELCDETGEKKPSDETTGAETSNGSNSQSNGGSPEKNECYTPHNIADKEAEGGYTRKSKRERAAAAQARIDYTGNKELKKLQFFGAGPKAAVAEAVPKDESNDSRVSRTKAKKVCYVDLYICLTCNRGDSEESMLLCDGCDAAYHTFCLIPPLNDIPKGDWRCPKCIADVCHKPREAFGFEQAQIQYSLQTFGEMADQFKLDYFNMPVHMVPYSTVEKEFWRLVNCIEEDVMVQYGADIHALEMGSGFPTERTKNLLPEDMEYLKSGWNLNNLPVLGTSILKYINADVSGMKVPWCYVGMCFSSFCWHIEDHWSYSINYMHWGEPKTWYGVPGSKATLLESVMKRNAPDLFSQSPDLLHHITTIMNPNILMAYGVPIVRTDQCAGEFIITFPRSYHAGFNQGYNFAEAVNFCPADWLPIGLECIDHYRTLKRHCVFSHEELICKMAVDPENLDLNLAAATHQDMLSVVEDEKRLRKILLEKGIVQSERELFELLSDDERQCSVCSTTCFMSGLTCSCSDTAVVCLYHMDDLCECPPSKKCLRYRYTLDELPGMLQKLKVRVEAFDNWAFKVKSSLEKEEEEKPTLQDLQELVSEAKEKRYPGSPLYDTLNGAIAEAEKCANVAGQLVNKKIRTRNRYTVDGKFIAKLSLQEIRLFRDQLNALPCIVPEAKMVEDYVQKVEEFQKEAQLALEDSVPDSHKLDKLIDTGVGLDVDLAEISQLKRVLKQARWLDNVHNTLSDTNKVTIASMRRLIESGVSLAPHAACEKAMAHLQEVLTNSESIDERAKQCLHAKPRSSTDDFEKLIAEAETIPAHLPNIAALKEALKKANEWITKATKIQRGEHYPYLDILESLVAKGKSIPVHLEQLTQIESQVAAAKAWRDRTARTFLKKNSAYSLYEVLSPRLTSSIQNIGKAKPIKQRKGKDGEKSGDVSGGISSVGGGGSVELSHMTDERLHDMDKDPAATVAAFKQAEVHELDAIIKLRQHNIEKTNIGDVTETKYCVCRKPSAGSMLECELCKDWFHSNCVPLPKSANKNAAPSSPISAAKDLKFLCPMCLRSRRPRLETILSLLVSLQKLPVRLLEGEALQCLTERSMAWQDKARQTLLTKEVAGALRQLSIMSQRAIEQAAREKTAKIITAELKKAARNPELQGRVGGSSGGPYGIATPNSGTGSVDVVTSPNEEVVSSDVVSNDACSSGSRGLDSGGDGGPGAADDMMGVGGGTDIGEIAPPVQHATPTTTDMSEHAYSSVSKAPGSPRQAVGYRKSNVYSGRASSSNESNRTTDALIKLPDLIKDHLEELMIEGDLLEVSLDETQHIWRILQACQNNLSNESLINMNMEEDPENAANLDMLLSAADEKKKRKRKKDIQSHAQEEDVGDDGMTAGTSAQMGTGGTSLLKPPKKKKLKPKPLKDNKEKLVKVKGELMTKAQKAQLLEQKRLRKLQKKQASQPAAAHQQPLPKNRAEPRGENDSDNDEDCSADKCLKPIGRDICWVQCDRCELWFHVMCIGIKQEDVKESDDDFICPRCSREGGRTIRHDSDFQEHTTIAHDTPQNDMSATVTDTNNTMDEDLVVVDEGFVPNSKSDCTLTSTDEYSDPQSLTAPSVTGIVAAVNQAAGGESTPQMDVTTQSGNIDSHAVRLPLPSSVPSPPAATPSLPTAVIAPAAGNNMVSVEQIQHPHKLVAEPQKLIAAEAAPQSLSAPVPDTNVDPSAAATFSVSAAPSVVDDSAPEAVAVAMDLDAAPAPVVNTALVVADVAVPSEHQT